MAKRKQITPQQELKRLTEAFETFKAKAAKSIERIAAERDRLRNLLSDYEDICEAADTGIEWMEDALRSFDDGLDEISRTV